MNNISFTKIFEIFFFGMAFQFIAHTFVTYTLQLPDTGIFSVIRARKEILVLMLGIICLFQLQKEKKIQLLWTDKDNRRILGTIGFSFTVSSLNSFFIHHQSIGIFIMSARFTYFPLIIGVVGYLCSKYLVNKEQKSEIIDIVIQVIKTILVFSLLRYILLHSFPNVLDRIGYSQPLSIIERTPNSPPPSLWLTEFYTGYIRNQGPLSGPLDFGFYLACLWPLFYAKVLYEKKISQTRGRYFLYILMIMSSFSRAAWGMFLISTTLLTLVIYRKHTRYIIGLGLGIVLLLISYIQLGGKSELVVRTRSDSGHREYITQGMNLIQENWKRGLGAASVGPASFHNPGEKAFNPENQYMQLRLEYGLMGLFSRLLSYIVIMGSSIRHYYLLWRQKAKITLDDILAISPIVGSAGLVLANMVLHPMSNSASMYPFMMISGIILGTCSYYTRQHENKSNSSDSINNSTNKTIVIKKSDKEMTIKSKNRNPEIFSILKIFSIAIISFFTIQTIAVYTFHFLPNTALASIIRDSIIIGMIIISIIQYQKHIYSFYNINYKILRITTGISILAVIHLIVGYNNGISLLTGIAGIKFDIHYIIIFVMGLRLGSIIRHTRSEKDTIQYIRRYGYFICSIVITGIVWQISKNVWPDLFLSLGGMSTPQDFVPFHNPPIYYLTGSGGIQRLSGRFVGPNTLGFFLIAFTSFVAGRSLLFQKWKRVTIRTIYILIAIATLSRGVVIGVTLQIIILLIRSTPLLGIILNRTKRTIIIAIVSILSLSSLLFINQRKTSSNTERTASLSKTMSVVLQKPLFGQGPGFVGPGKHYERDYLENQKNPLSMIENIYLQIFINQGSVGFVLWMSIWIILAFYQKQSLQSKIKEETIYYGNLLGLGLLGLLSVGLFLHVFIDSMVNYLFFIIYGITASYNKHKIESEKSRQ